MKNYDSVTVLTTAEHAHWFKPVFGETADYRYDPNQTHPLSQFMGNVTIAGGSLMVIDEAHVISGDLLATGIREYVDNPARRAKSMRIIIVCHERKAGDQLLSYLCSRCHVLDIVYDTAPDDVADCVRGLLQAPNSHTDIVQLLPVMPEICTPQESFSVRTLAGKALMEEQVTFPAGIKVQIVVEQVGA